jgi:hypothetical protein
VRFLPLTLRGSVAMNIGGGNNDRWRADSGTENEIHSIA